MFLVPFAILPLLLQSPAAPQPVRDSLPVQFVLRNARMKQHATVVDNELTITSGVHEPYLSSIKLGDFEASGEIAMPADGAATLLLYATVDEDARAHRRLEIAFPSIPDRGWHPMVVSSLNGHVRVSISDHVVAEREVESDGYGLFGFEVSTGQLSLRKWRVRRKDPYWDPLPTAESASAVDTKQLPGNAEAPRLRHEVKPQYTEDAMRHKIEGDVELEAIVEVDGTVGPVHITKSLDEDLDRQAVKALKQWQFDPALVDGKAVACRINVVLSFALRGR